MVQSVAASSSPPVASPSPLLQIRNLSLAYPNARPVVHDLSFDLYPGQTTALVGESGSGKSTLAKALVGLLRPLTGRILLQGSDIATLSPRQFLPVRKRIQMVFQDPWHALNPRLSMEQLLREPLSVHWPDLSRAQQRQRILQLLDKVHLPREAIHRFPSELSGGQRQRILLARALAVQPEILICDEPVSALDVSIQARLLDLLRELRAQSNLTLLFISHDLAVVQDMAREVLVLRKGRLVEQAPSAQLFAAPQHPYTRELIDACPTW